MNDYDRSQRRLDVSTQTYKRLRLSKPRLITDTAPHMVRNHECGRSRPITPPANVHDQATAGNDGREVPRRESQRPRHQSRRHNQLGDGHITVGREVVDPAEASTSRARTSTRERRFPQSADHTAACHQEQLLHARTRSRRHGRRGPHQREPCQLLGLVSSPGGSPWWVAFRHGGPGFRRSEIRARCCRWCGPRSTRLRRRFVSTAFRSLNNTTTGPEYVRCRTDPERSPVFIFATEDGTISAGTRRSPLTGRPDSAMLAVDNSAAGASRGPGAHDDPLAEPICRRRIPPAISTPARSRLDKGFNPSTFRRVPSIRTLPAGWALRHSASTATCMSPTPSRTLTRRTTGRPPWHGLADATIRRDT